MSRKGAAFALVATTTGSLAIPAGMAEAATPTQWEAVAQCESTNDWSINTGNGFYGGLQFTQKTWDEFGGRQFAPRADLATKQQQIAIAEKVLASQGKGAWPICGKGLSAISAVSTVGADMVRQTVEPISQPRPVSQPVPQSKPHISAGSYTVVSGDTLFSIAAKFRIPLNSLINLNPQIRNPALIFAGDRVHLPAAHSTPQPSPKRVVTQSVQTSNQSVVSAARSFLGDPYKYGGTSTSGLDCSALIQLAYKKVGISLPRTADAQMRVSHTITRVQLQPGDLAFSVDSSGHAYHVALYIGNGQVIESPKPGGVVSIRPLYASLTQFGRIA